MILLEGVPIIFFKGKQIKKFKLLYIIFFFFNFRVRVFLGTPYPQHGVNTAQEHPTLNVASPLPNLKLQFKFRVQSHKTFTQRFLDNFPGGEAAK